MKIQAGDKVKIIDENAQGIVVSLGKQVRVLIEGMEFLYDPDELIKISNIEKSDNLYSAHLPRKEHIKADDKPKARKTSREEKATELGRVRGKRNFKKTLEFDLHIHDLLVKTDHMTPGEMLNYQLDYAVNCLEESIKKRELEIVFIHGVGKGVLKIELHQILNAYGFNYHDGFMNEYGYGATRVELR